MNSIEPLAKLRETFIIKRPDGTTPAERFFESKYDDLLNNFLSRAV